MELLSALKKVVVAVVALLVVSSVALGGLIASGTVEVASPTVESVETEWGTVTEDETAIRTTVVVDNPNPVGVPGIMNIDYEASMNSVTLASGQKNGVGLGTGRNEIELDASIPNDRIAEWWVTHINNDERSTLGIRGTVSGPGISRDISQNQTIETDLLAGLTGAERRVVSAGGQEFLVLEDQTASWGEATAEETPVTFTTTVTNVHDYGVTLDGMEYVVTMNNVTVGEGVTTEGIDVAPGETSDVSITAALNTSKISDWWATHVRRGEESVVSVQMYGYVEEDGERKRVPLQLVDRKMQFDTDILGDGSTTAEPLETEDPERDFAAPSIEGTEREWGEVTEARTNVRTTTVVDNPNEGNVNELLDVTVGQTVTINDVQVSEGSTTFDGIESGRNQLVHVAALDNSKVPQWWARHVNNGERSTMRTEPTGTVDVGFTKFDMGLESSSNTVETDMLAGVETDQRREMTVDGRTVAVIHSQSAEWGEATTQRTPFTVSVTIENTERVPITIEKVDYAIGMNDVTAGEGTAPESYTIEPGVTRTIEFTFVIDSQKMDEWWVSHIRNGETTVVDFDATATVSAGTTTETVRLTPDEPQDTVTTDFLGTNSTAVAVPI